MFHVNGNRPLVSSKQGSHATKMISGNPLRKRTIGKRRWNTNDRAWRVEIIKNGLARSFVKNRSQVRHIECRFMHWRLSTSDRVRIKWKFLQCTNDKPVCAHARTNEFSVVVVNKLSKRPSAAATNCKAYQSLISMLSAVTNVLHDSKLNGGISLTDDTQVVCRMTTDHQSEYPNTSILRYLWLRYRKKLSYDQSNTRLNFGDEVWTWVLFGHLTITSTEFCRLYCDFSGWLVDKNWRPVSLSSSPGSTPGAMNRFKAWAEDHASLTRIHKRDISLGKSD